VKRKASFMAIEDYIDIRDSMGPECQFKIDVQLFNINSKSLYSSIDKFCTFNSRQIQGKKALRHQQADRQMQKLKRVMRRFMMLI
jgi:hypothetical protein